MALVYWEGHVLCSFVAVFQVPFYLSSRRDLCPRFHFEAVLLACHFGSSMEGNYHRDLELKSEGENEADDLKVISPFAPEYIFI